MKCPLVKHQEDGAVASMTQKDYAASTPGWDCGVSVDVVTPIRSALTLLPSQT